MWILALIVGLWWWRSRQVGAGGDIGASLADFGAQISDVFTGVGGEVSDIVAGVAGDPLSLAASLVKGFEGFSASAYPDPPNQAQTWSIGYGHQIRPGEGLSPQSVITESQADALLRSDLQSAYDTVTSSVRVALSPYQTAALTSLTYNIGGGAFRNSTLLAKLNAGDISGAAGEFGRWVYASGSVLDSLVTRRDAEQAFFEYA